MKPFKCLVLSFVLSAWTCYALAQDYVITKEGKTLRGEITKFNDLSVKIKPSNGRAKKFYAEDIKQFKKAGRLYLSREVYSRYGNEQKLLKVEKQGVVNLLMIDGKFNSTFNFAPSPFGYPSQKRGPDLYYVEKSGEVTILTEISAGALASEKRRKQIIEVLLTVMGDKPEIAEKIKVQTAFNAKYLTSLVAAYNM